LNGRNGVQRLRRVGQFALDALTGRLGVFMMTLSYAVFAVVLLGYVSTQVYTNSLMEDIGARRREQAKLRERIGHLTAKYASLASRARVADYCEEKLSMVEADTTQMVRVSVEDGHIITGRREFIQEPVRVTDMLGSELGDLTEVIRR
jgi:hypothetical protein